MGEQRVSEDFDHERLRVFTRALLIDMWALDQMLVSGRLESGIRRIGAEQEMFLVDPSMRPAPLYAQVLHHLNDSRFVTELAKFNLEANVTPIEFTGRCLRVMEAELQEMIALVRRAAAACNADVVLTGILPTLMFQDLTMENITDLPRYRELNRTLTELRGREFVVHIKGQDELDVTSDSMMLEACNTSFQVHYQVDDPERFHEFYNVAQAITAPLLAASVNSPLLFRKRLWHETRLALFEHSVDERSTAHQERERPPRVGFGDNWMRGSVMELYREDAARFRVIMTTDADEDPAEVLMRGEVPRLSALRIHNGTVWHWNRPCYGILDGKPHLRIENRVLPAGPSVIDEMANAALFFGLMHEMTHEYAPIHEIMNFDHAKENFYTAARQGLNAQFHWVNGKTIPSSDLIMNEMIPLARQGLQRAGIDSVDIGRYLGVMEERIQSGITGSRWVLNSLAGMSTQQTHEARCRLLTESMLRNERSGIPVHCWEPARLEEPAKWVDNFRRVGQFMSTDLFTVRPGDLVDLAACIMDWERIRHVPVEDDAGKLVGLLSHRDLLRLFASGHSATRQPIPVRDIMKVNPVTVTPETSTLDAIGKMRECRIGCLPVVRNDRLVGIVTLFDLLAVSSKLLEQALKEETHQNKEAPNDLNRHGQIDFNIERSH